MNVNFDRGSGGGSDDSDDSTTAGDRFRGTDSGASVPGTEDTTTDGSESSGESTRETETTAGDRFRGTESSGSPVPGTDDTSSSGSDSAGETTTTGSTTVSARDRLRSAGDTFSTRVAQPIGGAIATASPATELDRVVSGTPVENFVSSFGSSVIDAANIPAIADTTIGAGQRVSTDARRTAAGDGDAVAADARDDVLDAGAATVEAFRGDPASTTGSAAGALVGGTAVATAGVRGAQRVSRGRSGSPDRSRSQLDDFIADDRGQRTIGSSRSRSDRDSSSDRTTDVNIDDLDALMERFERGAGLREANRRVEERSRERSREAAQRQDPGEPRSVSPTDFDTLTERPFRTVSRGVDTSRSGPTPTQRRTARMSLDKTDLSPLDRQLAAGIGRRQPGQDLRAATEFDVSDIDASVGASLGLDAGQVGGAAGGTAAGLGELDRVNDPSGIQPGAGQRGRAGVVATPLFDDLAGEGAGVGVLDRDLGTTGVGTGIGTTADVGTTPDVDIGTDIGVGTPTDIDTDVGTTADTDLGTESGAGGTTPDRRGATTTRGATVFDPIADLGGTRPPASRPTSRQPRTVTTPRPPRRTARTPRPRRRDEPTGFELDDVGFTADDAVFESEVADFDDVDDDIANLGGFADDR